MRIAQSCSKQEARRHWWWELAKKTSCLPDAYICKLSVPRRAVLQDTTMLQNGFFLLLLDGRVHSRITTEAIHPARHHLAGNTPFSPAFAMAKIVTCTAKEPADSVLVLALCEAGMGGETLRLGEACVACEDAEHPPAFLHLLHLA